MTFATLKAFIEVESPGRGFDPATGKILVQFEPAWFRKHEPYAPSGKWSVNKVDIQRKEWEAFNNAWLISPDSAMKSTSIGLGQIMGFHYQLLGYKTVGDMWDDAKRGEYQQVLQLVRFLKSYKNGRILTALAARDFTTVATLYNGAGFRELAKKYGREPYDISLRKAFDKYAKMG